MKKVLFVATVVRLHINMFHKPYIKWFHDQGWQVDVAANNDYEKKEECTIPYCDNFYVIPFERSPLRKENFFAYKQLKELLDREQYDLIHCHTPMGGVLTRLAARKTRRKGAKVLYTAHGFHFYKGAPAVNWLVYYPIERILARETDLLITMNQEDYDRAKTFPAKRIEKVNGVGMDIERFSVASAEQRQDVRERFGLQKDDIFAITVAQLIPRKNYTVLIRAVQQLADSRFQLFIVGDGAQEEELKQQAKALGVAEQIHFLGFRKDVDAICSAADLFLFASLQEGLPVALMEAMACGLPIVASDIRGNRDLVDGERGGYLVEPKDVAGFVNSIKELLGDSQKQEQMRQYNLQKIQNYSIEAVTKQMSEIYRNIM